VFLLVINIEVKVGMSWSQLMTMTTFVCFLSIFMFCDWWHSWICIYSFLVMLVLHICVVLLSIGRGYVLDECVSLFICVLI